MNSTRLGPISGRVLPCFLAFLASFCIMVVELVAGRVIARHVGQSLYTWTSAIGVVLAGITIGNLIGGRLADWFDTRKTLAVLFLCSALACLAIPILNAAAGEAEWLTRLRDHSWPLRIAAHVTYVFLAPATCLGLVGPVVAKLALDQGRATGKTVGNVYAWGALGSILGTFATGFYLIPAFTTSGIIFGVSGVLGLIGTVLLPFFIWPGAAACLLLAFLLLGGKSYWEKNLRWDWKDGFISIREVPADDSVRYLDESQYSYIKIDQDADGTRDLVLDNLVHAHFVPGDPEDLRYEYEKIYAALTARFAETKPTLRTLFIGGGGYIFPRFIRSRWPGSVTEVAEIDPAVTRADLAAFGLRRDEVNVVGATPDYFPPEEVFEPVEAGDAQEGEATEEAPEAASVVEPVDDGEAKARGPDGSEAEAAKDASGAKEEPGSKGDAGERAEVGDSKEVPVAGGPPPPRIEIHHLDARNHVDDLVRRRLAGKDFEPYDYIYGDAFNDFSVPPHLVTEEFTRKIRDLLRPATGIYMINVIDIYRSGLFLGAVYNTVRKVFPYAYVYVTNEGGPSEDKDQRDTFIVVGALRDLDKVEAVGGLEELGSLQGEISFAGSRLEEEHLKYLEAASHGLVLTDEYCPVENLLEPVVCRRG